MSSKMWVPMNVDRSAKTSPDSNQQSAILTLAPFCRPPQLSFGRVALGNTRVVELSIENPHDAEKIVLISKFPNCKFGFTFDRSNITVSAHQKAILPVAWTPKNEGKVHQAIGLFMSNNFCTKVSLIGEAFVPKRKKSGLSGAVTSMLHPIENIPVPRCPITQRASELVKESTLLSSPLMVPKSSHRHGSLAQLIDISSIDSSVSNQPMGKIYDDQSLATPSRTDLVPNDKANRENIDTRFLSIRLGNDLPPCNVPPCLQRRITYVKSPAKKVTDAIERVASISDDSLEDKDLVYRFEEDVDTFDRPATAMPIINEVAEADFCAATDYSLFKKPLTLNGESRCSTQLKLKLPSPEMEGDMTALVKTRKQLFFPSNSAANTFTADTIRFGNDIPNELKPGRIAPAAKGSSRISILGDTGFVESFPSNNFSTMSRTPNLFTFDPFKSMAMTIKEEQPSELDQTGDLMESTSERVPLNVDVKSEVNSVWWSERTETYGHYLNFVLTMDKGICDSKEPFEYDQWLQWGYVRYQKMQKAAVIVQANYRGFRQRRKYLRFKNSTIIVQRWYLSVTLARRDRQYLLRIRRAVIKIQATFRMSIARKAYIHNCTSVVKSQAIVRGFLQRRRTEKLRRALQEQQTLRIHSAAIKIQTTFRVSMARKAYLRDYESVVKCQAIVRGFLRRRRMKKLRWAVEIFQRRFRALQQGREARKRFSKIRNATIVIQAWWRRLLARKRRTDTEEEQAPENYNMDALSTLLARSHNLSTIHRAVQHLEVTTSMSKASCQQLADSDALIMLIQMMRNRNRSMPHVEIVNRTLGVLINVAKCDAAAAHRVFVTEQILEAIIHLISVYCKKSRGVFTRCCSLLWQFAQDEGRRNAMRDNLTLTKTLHRVHASVHETHKLATQRLRNRHRLGEQQLPFHNLAALEVQLPAEARSNATRMRRQQRADATVFREFDDPLIAIDELLLIFGII